MIGHESGTYFGRRYKSLLLSRSWVILGSAALSVLPLRDRAARAANRRSEYRTLFPEGAVAGVVGNLGGVVSGLFNEP
jgi:hypothetical protein